MKKSHIVLTALFFIQLLLLTGCTVPDGILPGNQKLSEQKEEIVEAVSVSEPKKDLTPPKYCLYEGCTVEMPKYRDVCWEHKCQECYRIDDKYYKLQLQGSRYCDLHTCLVPECYSLCMKGYHYCGYHARKLNQELMDRRKNLCAIRYCEEAPKEGSNFCKEHICPKCTNGMEPSTTVCGEHVWWETDRSNFISGQNIKGYWYEGSSKSSHHSNSHHEYDPDDYDSPDDFADDAWGRDFDDWEDAYDYWEEHS